MFYTNFFLTFSLLLSFLFLFFIFSLLRLFALCPQTLSRPQTAPTASQRQTGRTAAPSPDRPIGPSAPSIAANRSPAGQRMQHFREFPLAAAQNTKHQNISLSLSESASQLSSIPKHEKNSFSCKEMIELKDEEEEMHTKERKRCSQQEYRDRSHEGKSVKEPVWSVR